MFSYQLRKMHEISNPNVAICAYCNINFLAAEEEKVI